MINEPALLIQYNYINLLKDYFNNTPAYISKYSISDYSFKQIVNSNNLDILSFLIEDAKVNISSDIMYDVIKIGRFETIEYLESQKVFDWDYIQAMVVAPLSKQMDLLKYITERTRYLNNKNKNDISKSGVLNMINNAIQVGRLDMVEWILDYIFPYFTSFHKLSYASAILNNDLKMVEYLLSKVGRNRTDIRYIDDAASIGLPILQVFHSNNFGEATTEAMNNAAWFNHFDILKWLHENRTEGCTSDAMDGAARNGNLEMVKWLHENRTEGCTQQAMNLAAGKGHLDVVIWLHENRTEGCSTRAMVTAAQNGHLETIKWLHQNRTEGCTVDAIDLAAQNGNLETIKWLYENRTEEYTFNAINWSLSSGEFQVFKWLYHTISDILHVRVHIDYIINANVEEESIIEILEWIHKNCQNIQCTTDAMDNAAIKNHLQVVQWLHDNRTEGCSSEALHYAIKFNHFDMVKWLNKHFSTGEPFVGDGELLRYTTVLDALLNNRYCIVKWLYENNIHCKDFILEIVKKNSTYTQLIKRIIESEMISPLQAILRVFKTNIELLEWILNTYQVPINQLSDFQHKWNKPKYQRIKTILNDYISKNNK